MANTYNVEDDYLKVLNAHVLEGRWFTEADKASKISPVVINEKLKEEMFGNENAVGKIIGDKTRSVESNRRCSKYERQRRLSTDRKWNVQNESIRHGIRHLVRYF